MTRYIRAVLTAITAMLLLVEQYTWAVATIVLGALYGIAQKLDGTEKMLWIDYTCAKCGYVGRAATGVILCANCHEPYAAQAKEGLK